MSATNLLASSQFANLNREAKQLSRRRELKLDALKLSQQLGVELRVVQLEKSV